MRWLNEDTRAGNVQRLIMAIKPSCPVDEILIRLPEQVEEKFRWHILIEDPLQTNNKN